MKRVFSWLMVILFVFSTDLFSATIGSDTSPTRFNTIQTLNDNDRIAGFVALYGGFNLSNSLTTGILPKEN